MAGKFASDVAKVAKDIVGATFWLKKTVTSSAILTTSVDITGVAVGGELVIEDVLIKSDGTGLAAGTTFRVVSNNSNGTTSVFMYPVAKLGANKQTSFERAFNDPATQSIVLGVNIPVVLELGKKLSVSNTDAASTGAGTIDIYIKFRKLSDSSRIVAA